MVALCAVPSSAEAPPLVDVLALEPRLRLDIRYAKSENFFGQKVYPEARCLLRPEAAAQLVRAQAWLDRHRFGTVLLLKDCYRPHAIQWVLWNAVKNTPKRRYVANPGGKIGSIHSYGLAVDLTLSRDGVELDMGTAYDHLGRAAEPRHEAALLARGRLSATHVENRKTLRAALRAAGFTGISREWWHFNAAPRSIVKAKYPRLDVPFSAVPRPPPPASD